MSGIGLGQTVDWLGQRAEVVGIMAEPSAIIEFPNGERQTVVLSNLAAAPVPPLPTVPYTVIRVTWKDDDRRPTDEWAFFGDDWVDVDGEAFSSNYLHQRITSFRILSEPRAVTAKAALGKARAYVFQALGEDVDFGFIAREFGVES